MSFWYSLGRRLGEPKSRLDAAKNRNLMIVPGIKSDSSVVQFVAKSLYELSYLGSETKKRLQSTNGNVIIPVLQLVLLV
jgi:hypothetical protein